MNEFYEYQSYSHDDEKRRELEGGLVKKHKGLAVRCAERFFRYLGPDDAIQEALIGLLKAIRAYNPEKSNFSTYAVPVIRNHLCSVSGLARRSIKSESLDAIKEDQQRWHELEATLIFRDKSTETVSIDSLLKPLRRMLPYREYEILTRCLSGKSQKVLGKQFNISVSRVAQIEKRAKHKAALLLREQIGK